MTFEYLKMQDKVHVHRRQWGEGVSDIPVALGVVIGVYQYEVMVLVDTMRGWDGKSHFMFSRSDGSGADRIPDRQITNNLYIRTYSDEKEIERRVAIEQERIAKKMNQVKWHLLPVDALDDICAILRENGEDA